MLRMDFPVAVPAVCTLIGGREMRPSGARGWRRRRRRCAFEPRGVDDISGRRVLEATLCDRTVLAGTMSAHFCWRVKYQYGLGWCRSDSQISPVVVLNWDCNAIAIVVKRCFWKEGYQTMRILLEGSWSKKTERSLTS